MSAETLTAVRREQAESRLLVIRNALTVADEELARALAERDWEVFGLGSFAEYCAEMLPELRHIKLRVAERRARTKALLEADPGVTEREVAAATGASAATAHRDVLAVTGRVASNEASRVVDPHESRSDQVVRLIAAAGAEGLTSLELMREARCTYGAASGALSRVARQGRVRVTSAARGGYGVYVTV